MKRRSTRILNISDSDLRLTIAYFLITCFVQFVILRQLGVGIYPAMTDTLATNIFLFFAVLTLKRIVNSFLSRSLFAMINFEIILALSALILGASYLTMYFTFPEHPLINRYLVPFILIKLVFIFLQLFTSHYQFWYTKNQYNLERSMQRTLEIERALQRAELNRIEQTIQPHFLFNSLNSISALMVINPDEAREMLHLLSDYLRNMVRKEKAHSSSLIQEIQHLQLYLQIEKIRFKERLDIRFEIEPAAEDYPIPVFILQPLIENAVKYGLYGTERHVLIHFSATLSEQGELHIRISNPYDPETEKAYQGEGFGLNSVRSKMNLLFSRNDLIAISRKNALFTVHIKIPKE